MADGHIISYKKERQNKCRPLILLLSYYLYLRVKILTIDFLYNFNPHIILYSY